MHKRPSQQKCLSYFRCDLTLQTYQIKLSATLYVKIHETGGKVLNMLTQCHFLLTFSTSFTSNLKRIKLPKIKELIGDSKISTKFKLFRRIRI